MYRLDREEFLKTPHVSLWSLLGFQAGYINAFGFLACTRYVSHVTGFGTQVGVALAEQRPWFALELFGFPFFFILGSFCSGVMTISKIERGKRPHFDRVMLLLPAMILLLMTLGNMGFFGTFGEELFLARDFFLVYGLSFICGMQNGCFATLTKGQIRTTHLTGISTDIGTDFARMWFGRLQGEELRLTRRANFSRIATFIGFSFGSVMSVLLGKTLGYSSLMMPLLTSFGVYLAVREVSKSLDQKYGTITTEAIRN